MHGCGLAGSASGLRMNILDLLQKDGIAPVHASRGEWHSPCPECGGEDRFSSWPDRSNSSGRYGGGRFVCRGCQWSGDGIAYLVKRRGLSFTQAVKQLGIDPGIMPDHTIKRVWTPAPQKEAPPAAWQAKAETFILACQKQLQGNSGVLKWLSDERGLSLKTIQDSRLGWNSKDLYLNRSEWGLSSEISQKTGKEKKLWIAQGLVIPDGDTRIRIRRSEPPPDESRYRNVSGSSMKPMIRWQDQQAVVILESELDGLLVHQEAGDLVGIVSLGSAQLKPDAELHDRLMAAKIILVSLDNDEAGMKAVGFWRRYAGFKRWPVIRGKDICEQWLAGIAVDQWVKAGLIYD